MPVTFFDEIDPGWAAALAPVAPQIAELAEFLRGEQEAGRGYLPAAGHVFAAFARPFAQVRLLIVGQDPYPTPGHAMGLSFSVHPRVRPVPRSLANIFAELREDVGVEIPETGDLRAWADQGVLMLNRVLTVEPGNAGSHQGRGWEEITAAAIRALAEREAPLVAILWGKHAQQVAPLLDEEGVSIIESAHPSPLSARRGFFGSRPFSRANEDLVRLGADPINWSLPAPPAR